MTEMAEKTGMFSKVYDLVKPVAKKVVFNTFVPGPQTKWLFSSLFQADYFGRELYEWARRSLVATPVFLSQCESYGDDICIEQLPDITGPCRIELGRQIRFAGKVNILVSRDNATLKLGNGVFIGHQTTFAIARRIELGDFVGIGERCHIADIEGHYAPDKPPTDDEIAEVVIEDNVQISQDCTILKGVRIGARAVIGAGSVVRGDIPADAVAMGNPARVVKRMNPEPKPEA